VDSDTKAVGTVMANRKEMPKETLSRKLKMGKNFPREEIISSQSNGVI
jgi:hypothetical protein